ncbi:MAG: ATP-binding protein [Desulfopila sp.]
MHSPKILKHYNIATRIGSVVGIILLLMLLLAAVEMHGLSGMRQSLDNIVSRHNHRLQVADDLRFLARDAAVVVRNVLLVVSQQEKDRELSRLQQVSTRYTMLMTDLQNQSSLTREERSIIDRAARASQTTFGLWRTLVDGAHGIGQDGLARILLTEIRDQQGTLLAALDELVEFEQHQVNDSLATALIDYSRVRSIMFLGNVLAIGAGLVFITVITSSIVGPLGEIGRKVNRIASGDLTTRVDLDQDDEIGQLAADINNMVEKLQANETELHEYRYHLEELIELRTGEINEQRQRFVSVLIHDLKGPLIPIVGFSRLLVQRHDLTNEKISRYAEEIHASTMRISEVIDQTTRSLKEKRMALSFDRKPFDVRELLLAVALNCLPAFKADSIELSINDRSVELFANGGKPLMFSGDTTKIRSLLENLLGNAGKYARSRVEVQLFDCDKRLQLTVDDDGCGVAEPFRRKIFEEYYQAPGSRDGTGVGLYSVKRVVDHYQGKVAVHRSPLGGARFEVVLPLG